MMVWRELTETKNRVIFQISEIYKIGQGDGLSDRCGNSKKWNISSRMIAYFCENGRIKGVVKKGKSWLMPASAEKPVDKRHFKRTVKTKDGRIEKGNGDLFTEKTVGIILVTGRTRSLTSL